MLLKRSIAETSLDIIHQIEESDEKNAKCACFDYLMSKTLSIILMTIAIYVRMYICI